MTSFGERIERLLSRHNQIVEEEIKVLLKGKESELIINVIELEVLWKEDICSLQPKFWWIDR